MMTKWMKCRVTFRKLTISSCWQSRIYGSSLCYAQSIESAALMNPRAILRLTLVSRTLYVRSRAPDLSSAILIPSRHTHAISTRMHLSEISGSYEFTHFIAHVRCIFFKLSLPGSYCCHRCELSTRFYKKKLII